MRTFLLPSVLFLLWGLLCPTTLARSSLLQDLEASGDDLEMEGSGSGDEPEEVIPKDKANDLGQSRGGSLLTMKPKDGTRIGSEGQPWDGQEIILAETKSFLENKEILAGVIAGGATGIALAVVLAGILIYKWQKKDDAGYIQGQQRTSDYHKDTHNHHREDVILV